VFVASGRDYTMVIKKKYAGKATQSRVDEVKSRIMSVIAEKKLREGDKLPTQASLRSELGVGSKTVTKAVRFLAKSSIVTCNDSTGVYVGCCIKTTAKDSSGTVPRVTEKCQLPAIDAKHPYKVKEGQRELFIDDLLIEKKSDNVQLKLHEPHKMDPDPTHGAGHYMTMLQADGRIRCYCRDSFQDYTGLESPFIVKPGFIGDFTAYQESVNGYRFMSPPLFIHDCGVPNVMLVLDNRVHNFCPFVDMNPDCKPEEKFKAIGGVGDGSPTAGAWAFVSADGYNFKVVGDKPIIKMADSWGYCMDSQNVVFWSVAEQCYVCYFRLNITKDGRKLRTIARKTSKDFFHWDDELEQFDINGENENLYVSQLAPYPRAPQFYIGTPTRIFEDRACATDICLIFSRAGSPLYRPYRQAWIKPGMDAEGWSNRWNYLALNVVQNTKNEMSYYHCHNKCRYSLRTDGYVSVSSTNAEIGEWTSKVLQYEGGKLEFNVATSAEGFVQFELQTPDGKPLRGASLENSREFYGDMIDYVAEWNNIEEYPLRKGDKFRIKCRMKDADIYSFALI